MSELPSSFPSRAEMDFILKGLKQVDVLRVEEIAAVADRIPFLQKIDMVEALQGINSIIAANEVLPDVDKILVDSFLRLKKIPQGFVQPGDGAMQIGERIAALETPEEQDEIIPKFLDKYVGAVMNSEIYSRIFETDERTSTIAVAQLGVQLAYPVMRDRKMKQIKMPWYIVPVYLATLQGLAVGGRTGARYVIYAEQLHRSAFEEVIPIISSDEKGLKEAWFREFIEKQKISVIQDIQGEGWSGKFFQTSTKGDDTSGK